MANDGEWFASWNDCTRHIPSNYSNYSNDNDSNINNNTNKTSNNDNNGTIFLKRIMIIWLVTFITTTNSAYG